MCPPIILEIMIVNPMLFFKTDVQFVSRYPDGNTGRFI
jgi:hypothetical protein